MESINLANALVENYGVAATHARDIVQKARGTILVDGEAFSGDPFNVPVAYIEGKTVEVPGDVRSFRFTVQ